VDRACQQLVDLAERHVDELFGQSEDIAHTHPEEDVGHAVGTFVGFEVPLDLVALDWRAERFQLRHEGFGGAGAGHVRHLRGLPT
jgi:hypothetical protein